MAPNKTVYYTSKGTAVSLGVKLGGGGEGDVFELANRSERAAKVYKSPPDRLHGEKLQVMASVGDESLRRFCAWPLETLHDRPGGDVAGFTMPRIPSGFKEIHELFGPRTRKSEFPHASWDFLVHASANLARAFAAVHGHGHVIGDVNSKNVWSSNSATAILIDCDSFQIGAGARAYPCDVGSPLYQPLELQGKPFRGLLRTPNHDNFGLAMLAFQLLVLGKHPFAGTPLGAGDIPPDRAIREYRFVYGSSAAAKQMRQPPNTPSLMVVSPPIELLLQRAFAPEGSRDSGRPSALDWVSALEGLSHELKRCARNSAHVFFKGLASCPWCPIEARTGAVLFVARVVVRQAGATFDVAVVWAQIVAIRPPSALGDPPDVRMMRVPPSAAMHRLGQCRRSRLPWAGGPVILACVLVFLLPALGAFVLVSSIVAACLMLNAGFGTEPRMARSRLNESRVRWSGLQARWYRERNDDVFARERRKLDEAHRRYLDLPTERAKRLTILHTADDRRAKQLRQFLDRQRLEDARIWGIRRIRKATLLSFGVETAADIYPGRPLPLNNTAISGFPVGGSFSNALVAWREEVERRFIFDPSRGPEPADVLEVESNIAARRQGYEASLADGPTHLARLARTVEERRRKLRLEAENLAAELVQAEADVNAFRLWSVPLP